MRTIMAFFLSVKRMTPNISFLFVLILREDMGLGTEIRFLKNTPERDVKICNSGSRESVSFCQSVMGRRGSVRDLHLASLP